MLHELCNQRYDDSQLFHTTDYERLNAMGVTQYGQMTAGSYMYIGPQGIVHGTTITLMNAARMKFGVSSTVIWGVYVLLHLA